MTVPDRLCPAESFPLTFISNFVREASARQGRRLAATMNCHARRRYRDRIRKDTTLYLPIHVLYLGKNEHPKSDRPFPV